MGVQTVSMRRSFLNLNWKINPIICQEQVPRWVFQELRTWLKIGLKLFLLFHLLGKEPLHHIRKNRELVCWIQENKLICPVRMWTQVALSIKSLKTQVLPLYLLTWRLRIKSYKKSLQLLPILRESLSLTLIP